MQRRMKIRVEWTIALVALVLLRMPALAQEATTRPDAPVMMLVLQRPADTAKRKENPEIEILDALRTAIRESGKFEVVTYSPNLPQIKRALREHVVASADLVEPIKMETLQHLGRAI